VEIVSTAELPTKLILIISELLKPTCIDVKRSAVVFVCEIFTVSVISTPSETINAPVVLLVD
jgi:hypothetical protein